MNWVSSRAIRRGGARGPPLELHFSPLLERLGDYRKYTSLNFLAKEKAKVECEGHPLVKIVAKTKCPPQAITLVRADWEADEKRRPRLHTGKCEEKDCRLQKSGASTPRSTSPLFGLSPPLIKSWLRPWAAV
jgi:hypothetical protein